MNLQHNQEHERVNPHCETIIKFHENKVNTRNFYKQKRQHSKKTLKQESRVSIQCNLMHLKYLIIVLYKQRTETSEYKVMKMLQTKLTQQTYSILRAHQ